MIFFSKDRVQQRKYILVSIHNGVLLERYDTKKCMEGPLEQ